MPRSKKSKGNTSRDQGAGEESSPGLTTFSDRLQFVIGDQAVYAFARRSGISDTSLRSYLKGSVPSIDKAVQMAKAAGVRLHWLITGEGPIIEGEDPPPSREDFAYIPYLDISASAGTGMLARDEAVSEVIAFDGTWLRSKLNANPSQLSIITVRGDSMADTLRDGDLIFVDHQPSELRDGIRDGIYVFQMDGDLLVKRLQKLPGSLVSVISDNPRFPPFTLDLTDAGTDFTIIGRYRGHISFT